jgi:beta-lactamase class A
MSDRPLEDKIREVVDGASATRVAVAWYDYKTGEEFAWHADEYFHAASTIKLAVLLAVFKAADEGKLRLDDPLHVRNRFISMADGTTPYRLARDRDADGLVHDRIGRNMRIQDLARQMIIVSSNLATNVLVNHVGLENAQRTIAEGGIDGIKLVRGVEDNAAHEKGINNEVTAAGLVRLCRAIRDAQVTTQASSDKMLEIMFDQKFDSMIPAKLPDTARVAHKTGEVSTACHDAGLVYLEGRDPYALAILTEYAPETNNRHSLVAQLSAIMFEHASASDGKARE